MATGFSLHGILRAIPALIIIFAVGVGTAQIITDNDVRVAIVAARMNMRELAQGIEAYRVDYPLYPYDGYSHAGFGEYGYWYPPRDLTTPVAYVGIEAFEDPFRQDSGFPTWYGTFLRYVNTESTWGDDWDAVQTGFGVSVYYDDALQEYSEWRVHSAGPDGIAGPGGWDGPSTYPESAIFIPYDPTNGLISDGDIIHSQLNSLGYPYMEFQSAVEDHHWRNYQ